MLTDSQLSLRTVSEKNRKIRKKTVAAQKKPQTVLHVYNMSSLMKDVF